MADITLIGLGSMGMALGRALLNGRRSLCVWNRSRGKMAPLLSQGALPGESLADAIAASPIVLVCIADYIATRALMQTPSMVDHLSGRTIVQLSTGTPAEARDAETYFQRHGATYLDGAIMAFPENVGLPDTTILFSGSEEVWQSCRQSLTPLGGDLRYVGASPGAAAALDFALLTRTLAMVLGIAHGARICAAEGVDLTHLAAVVSRGNDPRTFAEVIASGNFANPGATMNVWRHALQQIRDHARETAIGSDVPDFIETIFSRPLLAATATTMSRRSWKVWNPSELASGPRQIADPVSSQG
jgi:3-hydroxyisobutyrate dehydrogenase-like beta-hydroxyacid dehydrogenase